jgi:hypothetical protein
MQIVKCINDRNVLSTVDVHWWMISNWLNLSIYFSLVVHDPVYVIETDVTSGYDVTSGSTEQQQQQQQSYS